VRARNQQQESSVGGARRVRTAAEGPTAVKGAPAISKVKVGVPAAASGNIGGIATKT